MYEQSSFEKGVLRGQVNWRLGLLKIEIQEETVPPLRNVLQASRRRFYTEEVRASHYAVARYVCYYLQERELLVPYFSAFRANRDHDRYGIATLEETVGAQLEIFERDWTRFVRHLEFRRERRD